jgi:hypothetical protein
MLAARVYGEIWEIDARLRPFGVTRQELIEVVRGVVAARADSVDNDPVTAEGLFAYIFGTRYLRSLFRTKGYLLDRKENIEAVKHPDRELKIVYQSVDLAATRHHIPQAVCGKGSGADRIIDLAQGTLFTEEELAAPRPVKFDRIDTGIWFLCVSVQGDEVRAELSLPSSVSGGNFESFIERIFIVRDGEWSEIAGKSDDDAAQFEPVISRR